MSENKTSGAQEAMQKFGRFLSAMVMPNIGAFIAWGFITALFIPAGWLPNEGLAELVGPMAKWLLPTLIGFTGGEVIYGHRGGVVGAIATAGIIVGTDIPMFMGAMVMGPIGGVAIKKFDEAAQDSIPGGFEMLVNNFSAGIIGGVLAVLAYEIVGPIVAGLTGVLQSAVGAIVNAGMLPLVSIIVEPAKILFLNNAINHGIFTPLGMQQAQEVGKSIFFMIESNPGPGLGVLLAYSLFGTGSAKASAPGAVIIHFFGGIHEIYFPYVLMKPTLILAVIAGGISGVFTISLLGGGLLAPAAPGSFIAQMAMTPPGGYFANIVGIVVAAAVSFAVASVFIKATANDDEEDSLAEAQANMKAMKAASKGQAGERSKARTLNSSSMLVTPVWVPLLSVLRHSAKNFTRTATTISPSRTSLSATFQKMHRLSFHTKSWHSVRLTIHRKLNTSSSRTSHRTTSMMLSLPV